MIVAHESSRAPWRRAALARRVHQHCGQGRWSGTLTPARQGPVDPDRAVQMELAMTESIPPGRARESSGWMADERIPGLLFFLLAAGFMTVIMLAASMAPGYDIRGGAISDLGVIEETALLFNGSLILVGLLNALAAPSTSVSTAEAASSASRSSPRSAPSAPGSSHSIEAGCTASSPCWPSSPSTCRPSRPAGSCRSR